MTACPRFAALVAIGASMVAADLQAQSLGTFRWQLQPFCNVVTVNVIQQGAVYTMDGYDDQCGASQRAPLVGSATPNPDGSIGLGLSVVTVPGGRAVHIDARVSLTTLGGPWSDSAGNTGTFAFGAGTGGNPRPPVTGGSAIPASFALLSDGGFLAGGMLGVGTLPASGPGTRLMWHPGKSAFRAGTVIGTQWDDVNVGGRSVAMGFNTVASGGLSTALGSNTTASGGNSTAMGTDTVANGGNSTTMGLLSNASGAVSTALGYRTTASGGFSTALGDGTTASGQYATAMGNGSMAAGNNSVAGGRLTTATGESSLAMGFATRATGNFSTAFGNTSSANGSGSLVAGTASVASGTDAIAMGVRVNANGTGNVVLGSDATSTTTGNFLYGDRSTTTDLTTFGSNEFLVRAAGGTVFYSNAAMTTGVVLLNGTNSWAPISVSDENRKTDFRDLDGEQVLGKLAVLPVREWRYTTQDAGIRHVGPTAQDFRAAFGLGESDVRIGSVDADGIALAAIKALEARTRDSAILSDRLNALEAVNDELRARLARLESVLEKR